MTEARRIVPENLVLPVVAAIWEDMMGIGRWRGEGLAARIAAIARDGRRLPVSMARIFERGFGCDFSRVRVHVGGEVDQVAARLNATAFCVGTDIFLTTGVLDSRSPDLGLTVLCHELAHVRNGVDSQRIRLWGGEVHADLTDRACDAYSQELDALLRKPNIGHGKEDLIKGLKVAASNMDFRQRFGHPIDTLQYLPEFLSLPILLRLIRLFGLTTKGEGPRHGEGYNYTKESVEINAALNRKEEDKWLDLAKREFESDLKSTSDDGPTVRWEKPPWIIPPFSIGEKEWVKSLANALHCTQDRCSHREGTKGFGHDDPRCARSPSWSPDKPEHDHTRGGIESGYWLYCSMAAYNKALNNSFDVLERFFALIGIQARPARRLAINCYAYPEKPFDVYYSPYPNPMHKSKRGSFALSRGYRSIQPSNAVRAIIKLEVLWLPPVGRQGRQDG